MASLPRISFLCLVPPLFACATPAPGPAAPAPEFMPGERWSYRQESLYTGRPLGSFAVAVREAGREGAVLELAGDGPAASVSQAPSGMPLQRWVADGRMLIHASPGALIRFPLEAGRCWNARVVLRDLHGGPPVEASVDACVAGMEKISTPAGSFDAYVIRRSLYFVERPWWRSEIRLYETDWYAPQAKAVVRTEYDSIFTDYFRQARGGAEVPGEKVRIELAARTQAG
ncbi:hypothetical protein [Pelomicrobium sp. G1]|uniref:hypothetical protein n=1 Tax=unclassified Pelomicrobium TaxID=2815318 RepID=UPI003F769AE4